VTTRGLWYFGLVLVALVYLHDALPYLTMLPRVNVDEPWLMERGYQIMQTGIPSQPMLRLDTAYLLQVGYGYLLAGWMSLFGVGLLQARLLSVVLGFGIIVMVASIGRWWIDESAGLGAALFLATDSNFLGGVRDARTDIPSVFFVVVAFAAYARGQRRAATSWFVVCGAALGLAMLCHGNAFWAGLILLAWFLLDYGKRSLRVPFGYAIDAGWLLTFGPYLAMVIVRWRDVQVQIGNFAADRVPGWRPSFLLQQVLREPDRYRSWYFGLVTGEVPEPLLRVFQAAIVIGLIALLMRMRRPPAGADPHGAARLLILAIGCAAIFAALINNKVLVYLPHIMIGFALAAGAAVSAVTSVAPARMRSLLALAFVVAYGGAATAYYEKWYARERKGELLPYERTEATLRAIVPPGPKYVFASPQFWTPFHADPGVVFYSYAAANPSASHGQPSLDGVADDRPIVLVVDEYQWLPELVGVSSSTVEWQRTWIAFIESHCALSAVGLGTAHGTLAAYRCSLGARPQIEAPRLVGDDITYAVGPPALQLSADDLAKWTPYDDPRRTSAQQPAVRLAAGGLDIAGAGWPGIVTTFNATPGDSYLIKTSVKGTRDGDLLYLGTWQQPQLLSLGGAASAGMPASLHLPSWFPSDRAFRATAPGVRLLIYSEAPATDFLISSLSVYRLQPVGKAGR
jgi:4-amino-4-deoxy-L-arabinose transferase-like glycosyltransferase